MIDTLIFESVYKRDADYDYHLRVLYELLSEREPNESISHKEMPSWQEHLVFISTEPYREWCIVKQENSGIIIGSYYITHQNEIGISIYQMHRRKGYASRIIDAIVQLNPGVKFVANINPVNEKSKKLFRKFGFKHVQDTFVREPNA